MNFFPKKKRRLRLAALAWLALAPFATAKEKAAAARTLDLRGEPMVEVASVCPSIVIELPHPRTLDMKTHEAFGAYTRRIYKLLGME